MVTHRGKRQVHEPRRERLRQACEAEEPDEDEHPPDEGEDHHGELRGLEEGALEGRPAHSPVERDTHHHERAERARLGRGCPSRVHRAEDDRDDREDGDGGRKRPQPLAERGGGDGAPELRPRRALPNDEGRVDEGRHHSGQEAREDQGADRFLDDDRVDDEDRARRDEGGEGCLPPRPPRPRAAGCSRSRACAGSRPG